MTWAANEQEVKEGNQISAINTFLKYAQSRKKKVN